MGARRGGCVRAAHLWEHPAGYWEHLQLPAKRKSHSAKLAWAPPQEAQDRRRRAEQPEDSWRSSDVAA